MSCPSLSTLLAACLRHAWLLFSSRLSQAIHPSLPLVPSCLDLVYAVPGTAGNCDDSVNMLRNSFRSKTWTCSGAATAEAVDGEAPQALQLPSLPSPPEIVRSLSEQLSSFSSNGDAPSLTGAPH